jgi:hypothetical protein
LRQLGKEIYTIAALYLFVRRQKNDYDSLEVLKGLRGELDELVEIKKQHLREWLESEGITDMTEEDDMDLTGGENEENDEMEYDEREDDFEDAAAVAN